jgi:hypothetical protein
MNRGPYVQLESKFCFWGQVGCGSGGKKRAREGKNNSKCACVRGCVCARTYMRLELHGGATILALLVVYKYAKVGQATAQSPADTPNNNLPPPLWIVIPFRVLRERWLAGEQREEKEIPQRSSSENRGGSPFLSSPRRQGG